MLLTHSLPMLSPSRSTNLLRKESNASSLLSESFDRERKGSAFSFESGKDRENLKSKEMKEIVVYNGGSSGLGIENLTLNNIQSKQFEMFRRTIDQQAPRQIEDRLREKRQISIVEPTLKIQITICREDFPDIKTAIDIEYVPSSSQKAWEPLLSTICKRLKIEFIDSIIERGDKAPIYRIARFKDGGDYLVRQRESSAILEVLNSSIPPIENSWESTRDIVEVKADLSFNLSTVHRTNSRIISLVSQPMTTLTQKEISDSIRTSVRPDAIVQLINTLYLKNTSNAYLLDMKVETLNLNYNQMALFNKQKLDIITIHRQGIEKLNLMATQGQSENIVKECLHYLLNVIIDLIYEVDIVVLGLKCLSDLIPYLLLQREKIFNTVLDCIQYYSPLSPYHRQRKAPRLLEKQEKAERAAKEAAGGGEVNIYAGLMGGLGGLGSTSNDGGHSTKLVIEKAEIKTTFLRLVKDIPDEIKNSINKLTRYPADHYVLEDEKSIYRKDSQSMAIFQYSTLIELDENMQVLTPRTKKQRELANKKGKEVEVIAAAEAEKMHQEQLDEKKGKAEKEKQTFLVLQQQKQQLENRLRGYSSLTVGGDSSRPVSAEKSGSLLGTGKEIKLIITDRSRTINSRNPAVLPKKLSSTENGTDEKEDDDDDEEEEDEKKEKERNLKPSSMLPKLVEQDDQSDDISLLSTNTQELKSNLVASVLKPSDLMKGNALKKKKMYKIKPLVEEEDEDEEASSPVRWKGSKGELGRKPVANEVKSMNANRILGGRAGSSRFPLIKQSSSLNKNNNASSSNLVDPFASTSELVPSHDNDGNIVTTEDGKEIPPAPSTSSPAQSPKRSLLSKTKSRRFSLRFQSDKAAAAALSAETPTLTEATIVEGDPVAAGLDASKDSTGGAVGGEGEWLSNISTTILRKQKPKFHLEPLPSVDFPKFRIFDFQMKENVALTQCFATILKLLIDNYGNRDYAFRNHLLSELSEIILVCSALPKILEYFIDIFHVLYSEGLGDPLDITGKVSVSLFSLPLLPLLLVFLLLFRFQELEEPSMIFSPENSTLIGDEGTFIYEVKKDDNSFVSTIDENNSPQQLIAQLARTENAALPSKSTDEHSLKLIDCVSEMSLPSYDPDAQLSVVSVSDNKYNEWNRHKKNKKPVGTSGGGKGDKKAEGEIAEGEEKKEGDGDEGQPQEFVIQQITVVGSLHSINAIAPKPQDKKPEKNENIYVSTKEMQRFSNRQKIKYNEEIMSRIGQSEYDLRYRRMPADSVIIALSMCSHHIEVKELLREEGSFWLEYFNDTSRDYYMMKRKGISLASG
jgi:hypothetical protein